MSDVTPPVSLQRIVVRRRAEGLVTWDDVELVEVPVPGPGRALAHDVLNAMLIGANTGKIIIRTH